MREIDQKIREVLRQGDAQLADDLGEPSLLEMTLESFRGRHRWLSLMAAFWTLVFFVLGIFAAVQFLRAEPMRDMLLWAAAVGFCVAAVAMLKVWHWMEINRNFIIREIKRVELQVARLAAGAEGR